MFFSTNDDEDDAKYYLHLLSVLHVAGIDVSSVLSYWAE